MAEEEDLAGKKRKRPSPGRHRSSSGTLVKISGTNYLFDAGEGVQRQLQLVPGEIICYKV